MDADLNRLIQSSNPIKIPIKFSLDTNKEFIELLERMKEISEKKKHDYSSSGHYENFERSAIINSWFLSPVDKTFATLIGTKLARLGTLLSSLKEPNNESIEDSFLDLTVYCALWASYHKSKEDK